MSYPIGNQVSLTVSAEDKEWLSQEAKKEQLTQAACLRQMIAESLQNHTQLPDLPDRPGREYNKRIAFVVNSFQRSEMVYRENTVANYVRKLLWMNRSQEQKTRVPKGVTA